ncbi:hypothetical protein [Noviherbaspirillum malthae]|uniref:hypothetical protein n=1 Tax=Noviherbaspirillum malthae TaxID=1260987 RepID=UPI0018904AFA|nr:hypothetical protein [Noviherbaspirillum malthae]
MNNVKPQLSEKDILLLNTASDLAKAQLKRAVSIVGEVTGREDNEVDTSLVSAMVQVLASNYAALMTDRSARD